MLFDKSIQLSHNNSWRIAIRHISDKVVLARVVQYTCGYRRPVTYCSFPIRLVHMHDELLWLWVAGIVAYKRTSLVFLRRCVVYTLIEFDEWPSFCDAFRWRARSNRTFIQRPEHDHTLLEWPLYEQCLAEKYRIQRRRTTERPTKTNLAEFFCIGIWKNCSGSAVYIRLNKTESTKIWPLYLNESRTR